MHFLPVFFVLKTCNFLKSSTDTFFLKKLVTLLDWNSEQLVV